MTEQKDVEQLNNESGENGSNGSVHPSVSFDPAEFMHFLDEADWSEEEKFKYLALVWEIVCEFVMLGFDVHPFQQARKNCGKADEFRPQPPPETARVIDSSHSQLIEKFVSQSGMESASDGKGSVDG
ncbi:MAG: hypothetical protein P1U65_17375 [Minwuia sp.]|nr:hypothetical protein [Minwuia sp.]